MDAPILVGIFVLEGVELLDVSGPFEVFSIASSQRGPTPGAFVVKLIAEDMSPVTARGGLRLLPDYTIDDHPALDILIVTGGVRVRQDLEDRRALQWLTQSEPRIALASVRAGALLLAEAGRLDGLEATSNAAALDTLAQYEDVTVRPKARFVEQGTILTASGVSATLDMALHLVRRLVGEETVRYTTQAMEYEHRAPLPEL